MEEIARRRFGSLSAPAQSETDSSITFIAPKAATPRQRSSRFSACDLDAVDGLGGERIGRIAERLEPLEDDRRIERALVPLDGHALAREIDARAADARLSAQALLDRDDAGAAIDAVDDEIHRRDAVGGMAHEVRKVLRFRQRPLLVPRRVRDRQLVLAAEHALGARGSPRSPGSSGPARTGAATPS